MFGRDAIITAYMMLWSDPSVGHRHVNLVGWREAFGWGMVAG
jgi:hypothetical protein